MSQPPDYQHLRIGKADGVTEVVLHTAGDSLVWSKNATLELTAFLGAAAFDPETRVVVLTGAGDAWCDKIDGPSFESMSWRQVWAMEQNLLNRMIELNVIVISALNGPVSIHSDVPVLADIVLATPETVFADKYHFRRNVAPGDGVHLVWSAILGRSRATYFCLTGERLAAEEALRLGAVHEVVPSDQLLPRARELARQIAEKPAAMLAYTKAALRVRDRRNFRQDLSHSLALQGLGMHATGFKGPE
jgi:enoyl-CoA hydratase/carnithine racemase